MRSITIFAVLGAALIATLGVWAHAATPSTKAEAGPVPSFSAAEIRSIRAFGPWPPAIKPDPSNRVSGKPDAIAFGHSLFHDPRLSGDGSMSCVTCHRADRGFSDGRAHAIGAGPGGRNSLGLHNLRFQRWFGWTGGNDNLWAQSLRPILDVLEMDNTPKGVASVVRNKPDLLTAYVHVFGPLPDKDDALIAVNISKALAAYQETLVTPRTPFDQFRDALIAGDAQGIAAYPAAAQRGLATFVGKGKCSVCHSGPQFSNGEFHDIGIKFFKGRGGVDKGRYGGIQDLQASPYNLLGAYNDDPKRSTATSTRHVSLMHRNFGEFKVPSLRNVARTPPYMHNGSLATLADVVEHYSHINEERLHADGEAILVPLNLSPQEAADLVAFLESLSAP